MANHAGVLPIDALMLQLAVHDRHPKQRLLRLPAADLVFELPILGGLARKAGHTLACPADAERLLRSGELAGVVPRRIQGCRQALPSALQAAAVRTRRIRFCGGRGARADRSVLDRRLRGYLPQARRHHPAGPAARVALLPALYTLLAKRPHPFTAVGTGVPNSMYHFEGTVRSGDDVERIIAGRGARPCKIRPAWSKWMMPRLEPVGTRPSVFVRSPVV